MCYNIDMLGPFCHSCGNRLEDAPGGAGTEATGRESLYYCSECYIGGRFTEPGITFNEMVEKVYTKTKNKNHLPRFIAVRLIRSALSDLGRWKKL